MIQSLPRLPIIDGLRNYGIEGQIGLEKTFDEYLAKMLEIMAELKRVLKKTGTFFLNMGDCYGGIKVGNTETIKNPKVATDSFKKDLPGLEKCILMQPERLAMAMIDKQGWILRNKIKWAKQILIYKSQKTIGSVMPSSVKDRFNESGEELYFFVKSKKYYFDLDAVRLPPQTELEIERPRIGNRENSIKLKYAKGSEYEQKYGEPWDRFGQKTLKARMEDTKNKDQKSSRTYNIKKLLSEVRLGIKPNTGIIPKQDLVGNPTYTGFNKRWKEKYEPSGESKYNEEDFRHNKVNNETGSHIGLMHPAGKNLPTIWQIGAEPHNFSKELELNVEHFAVFPEALCEIPIKAGCPPGGIVLDPFSGAGTSLLVAKKLKRNFIGIELNPQYIKLAEKRLRTITEPLL